MEGLGEGFKTATGAGGKSFASSDWVDLKGNLAEPLGRYMDLILYTHRLNCDWLRIYAFMVCSSNVFLMLLLLCTRFYMIILLGQKSGGGEESGESSARNHDWNVFVVILSRERYDYAEVVNTYSWKCFTIWIYSLGCERIKLWHMGGD